MWDIVRDLLDKVGVCKDNYKLVSISCNLVLSLYKVYHTFIVFNFSNSANSK